MFLHRQRAEEVTAQIKWNRCRNRDVAGAWKMNWIIRIKSKLDM